MTDSETQTSRVDYAELRRQRATERSKARRRRVPVAAIVGALAVVVAFGAVDALASWDRIHPGVRVAGVSVGGMKPASAQSVLELALPEKAADPVAVTYEDKSWDVTPVEVGLSFDYPKMISDAMSVGREDNVVVALLGRLGAWVGASDLPARPAADGTRLNAVWDRIGEGTDVKPVDSSVKIDGVQTSVVPGQDGRGLDRPKAERLLLKAMLSDDRTVEAPITTVRMDVTADEAKAAQATADQMLSASARVSTDSKSWDFDPAKIAEWIAFRRSDQQPEGAEDTATAVGVSEDMTLVAYISAPRVGVDIVKAVGGKVGRPAKNASFTTRSGRVSIVPSQEGIGPDVDLLASDLTAELSDAASDRTVTLSTTRVQPTITTEDAEGMGIHERISRYTTTYVASNLSRVNNIHLLGDALDGKLIRPGGTFSFNGSVGERTAAKGYQEANAIVNGKLVPQLGGGICQVGTTMFNAVFESGLPITERHNHSFYISHYPKGRDATVSWGGPDFKFKNDTPNWVLLSVSYTSSSITIALYGTDPGYDVEASTSAWRNVKPFATETVKDATMYLGEKIIEDEGVTGRSITVTRTVQQNGQIIRTDSFISVYKPKTQVVRVGTKPRIRSKPTTTTPTP